MKITDIQNRSSDLKGCLERLKGPLKLVLNLNVFFLEKLTQAQYF